MKLNRIFEGRKARAVRTLEVKLKRRGFVERTQGSEKRDERGVHVLVLHDRKLPVLFFIFFYFLN